MYNAYITVIKNLRKHPNADRLLLGECCGNTVCVDTGYAEGEIGIYFPTDGQLSLEFCEQNNLLRKKDENGNNIGGYMDADKRNVQAIKLRGEKSDGIFLHLSCLMYTGVDMDTLNVGDPITVVNGHEICKKYIPYHAEKTAAGGAGSRIKRRAARSVAPLFYEHVDTEQLAYNLNAFKPGDLIEITLKMHGTSQRTAHLPVFKGYKRTIMDKVLHREGTPIYGWGYVSGTRRTVLENYDNGYYGSEHFREPYSKFFEGKLWKGETVYYEVVGFTDSGAPIMASADNKKLNDKEFVKQYGKTTVFSYGCNPTGVIGKGITECKVPKSAMYVYRMTMTNEDGQVVEYPPHFVRYRCEQMGANCVPALHYEIIPDQAIDVIPTEKGGEIVNVLEGRDWNPGEPGEWVKTMAEQYYDGADPIGKTHIREGVVVRIVNRPKFAAYKHKNWFFKALEGIVKVSADAPDMEEMQEVEAA